MAEKIRKGDLVKVMAGSNKGQEGKVISASGDWVCIDGVNMVIRHRKGPRGEKGKIETFPGHIRKCNVQHCVDGVVTRVGFAFVDGKKHLVSKKTGKEIRKV